MLQIIDSLLFGFHTVFTLFALSGWLWPRTRRAHLVAVTFTLISWCLFGLWHSWGYCFLTDWHWDIKRALGERNLPNSFIKYMIDWFTGTNISPALADQLAIAGLAVALTGIFFTQLRGFRRKALSMDQEKLKMNSGNDLSH